MCRLFKLFTTFLSTTKVKIILNFKDHKVLNNLWWSIFVQVCMFLSDLFILYSILNNSWKCRCIKIGKLFQKMISTYCDSAVLQNSLSLTYFFYFYSFPFKHIVRFFMWVMVLNVSSVVEFQRWWVLKSKLFAQESTCSKEILISPSLNHLWFSVDSKNQSF